MRARGTVRDKTVRARNFWQQAMSSSLLGIAHTRVLIIAGGQLRTDPPSELPPQICLQLFIICIQGCLEDLHMFTTPRSVCSTWLMLRTLPAQEVQPPFGWQVRS